MKGLLNSALSSGTHKLYQRAWATLSAFTRQFFHSENLDLPISITALALFISYLYARKLASSTIRSYLSAISYVHKLKGLCDPTQAFLINKLLTAVSRQGSCDIRLPISQPVLHQLVGSLGRTASSAFQRTLYSAMFLLAFYGFFRIGELAAKSANSGGTVVQYNQLRFLTRTGNAHMIKITITKLKHNTTNLPFDILIQRELSSPSLVPRPVRAIRVTRGGLEPSAIARGLAKNGKKVPYQREKVPNNFSTKTSVFCDNHRIFRTYEINTSLPRICGPF